MKRASQKGHSRRPSFKEILDDVRPGCGDQLGAKAHRANRIAKYARDDRTSRAAYSIKVAALEQGLRCNVFQLAGDDQARPWLVLVRTPTWGNLHVPVRNLSNRITHHAAFRMRLNGAANQPGEPHHDLS
jgi:hypothetical protein